MCQLLGFQLVWRSFQLNPSQMSHALDLLRPHTQWHCSDWTHSHNHGLNCTHHIYTVCSLEWVMVDHSVSLSHTVHTYLQPDLRLPRPRYLCVLEPRQRVTNQRSLYSWGFSRRMYIVIQPHSVAASLRLCRLWQIARGIVWFHPVCECHSSHSAGHRPRSICVAWAQWWVWCDAVWNSQTLHGCDDSHMLCVH